MLGIPISKFLKMSPAEKRAHEKNYAETTSIPLARVAWREKKVRGERRMILGREAKPAEKITATAFAAIRETDGRHWIDTSSINTTREQVQEADEKHWGDIPSWCEANPLIKIVEVTITATVAD